ncbi:MAG: MBL fold metallo-hydrolase [Candidatus Dependentiae bacterium]|nr:MBL fold metallo-hydrolase [Candidatus Dependentiae bacterium]
MKITFFGATQEVTGSKYLVESENTKVLVDCGLYQGEDHIKKHNWDTFPVDAKTIDAIVLTHAHLDHTGYIPVLVKNGFEGKVYCSKGTSAVAAIVLRDSGSVHEQDAKKTQLQPLYTIKDAENAITLFQTMDYGTVFSVGSLKIKLIQSFHILGSSFVVISDGSKTLTFSGDLGRPNQLIMKSPPHLKETDFLVLESTYGNKVHPNTDPISELGKIINQAISKQGTIIIPAFAIERTQTILYCLYLLRQKNIIPKIPIFLDSPMATSITNLFDEFTDEHTLSPQQCKDVFNIATYTATTKDSAHVDLVTGPKIIIAGSGMAHGGRVLNHLTHFIAKATTTIIFVGFQADGTNGKALINGANQIKIDEQWYPVNATVTLINSFSAHADSNEILQWVSSFEKKPKKIFLTHGELAASESLKQKIEKELNLSVVIPKKLESFDLN